MTIAPFRSVAVIGLGLIGGSLARTLVESADAPPVIAWDADPRTRTSANDIGIPVAATLEECLAAPVDLVILAVPLAAMGDTARAVAPLVSGATTVTDVGSVKSSVRKQLTAAGLSDRYIGSHPMAGTEKTGFDASSGTLLIEAPWVVTVEERSTVDVEQELRRMLALGHLLIRHFKASVFVMTDKQHDAAVALASHLPHVFAAQLLGQANQSPIGPLVHAIAAGSFRDGTRVAGTNPERTEAMIVGNRDALAPLIEQSADALRELAGRLRAGEPVGDFFAGPRESGLLQGEASVRSIRFDAAAPTDVMAQLIEATGHGMRLTNVDLAAQIISLRT